MTQQQQQRRQSEQQEGGKQHLDVVKKLPSPSPPPRSDLGRKVRESMRLSVVETQSKTAALPV